MLKKALIISCSVFMAMSGIVTSHAADGSSQSSTTVLNDSTSNPLQDFANPTLADPTKDALNGTIFDSPPSLQEQIQGNDTLKAAEENFSSAVDGLSNTINQVNSEVNGARQARVASDVQNQNINLSTLPGPDVGGLRGLLNAVIRTGGYLAGSVVLLLLVVASFLLIRGTKDAFEQFRTRVMNIFIGAILVFCSFIIVSIIWGIAWF